MSGCCCTDFSKTLQYVSPSHGGWGVIRVAALVPESHLLFVAPSACGRHGALGGIEAGIKERISYLYIDESDIVSGNYENLILDSVKELFDFLDAKPKVLFVFVSCIDDLLGTDNDAIIAELSSRHPDVAFRTCHMNPMSMDTPNPPGVTLLDAMYSLLPKQQKEKQVNLIGNNAAIARSCELFALLKKHDYDVCQISECATFGEFQALGSACLNLLLRPVAKKACKRMADMLGIPVMQSFVTYHIDEVCAFYDALSQKLDIGQFDYTQYRVHAQQKIVEAKRVLDDTPIAVDYQAVLLPFSLAHALVEYGFNVQLIVAKECLAVDVEHKLWIEAHCPHVQIVNAMHYNQIKYQLRGNDFLCIGFDAGYLTGSVHVSPLMDDDALFGFDGIKKMMDELIHAMEKESNVHKLIANAGLII
ncbi:MAG: hypothetical protein IJR50_01535 [Treponema sp.]|nr:hypothetical protein [Treponema sp.]